jgi:hypothetical protein
VRGFVSYSDDNREHCDRVLAVAALAQQLRCDGIDAELDQFHQDELIHWPHWCEERLRPENSVLGDRAFARGAGRKSNRRQIIGLMPHRTTLNW